LVYGEKTFVGLDGTGSLPYEKVSGADAVIFVVFSSGSTHPKARDVALAHLNHMERLQWICEFVLEVKVPGVVKRRLAELLIQEEANRWLRKSPPQEWNRLPLVNGDDRSLYDILRAYAAGGNGYVPSGKEHSAAREVFLASQLRLSFVIPLEGFASQESMQTLFAVIPKRCKDYILEYGVEGLIWIVSNTSGQNMDQQPRIPFEFPPLNHSSEGWAYGAEAIPKEKDLEICPATCRRYYQKEWKMLLDSIYRKVSSGSGFLSCLEFFGKFVVLTRHFPDRYQLMAYMWDLVASEGMRHNLPFQTVQFVDQVLEAYQPIVSHLVKEYGSKELAACEFAKRFTRSKSLELRIKMQELESL
jgi:hypothetical protein